MSPDRNRNTTDVNTMTSMDDSRSVTNTLSVMARNDDATSMGRMKMR